MEIFIAFVIGFLLGIIFTILSKKHDGRLVIDGDDYFIAITDKPEELTKRKWINLRVFVREGAQE